MRYFDYKPAAYVNVHPDIPVEWMQSQLDLSQKRKDIQRAAVDKEVELLKNIKYGELGKDLYQQIKSAYEEPFKKMSEELSLTGNVSEVSRKFSETVRDLALDERVKDLQKDYQAYEQYQKNLMDPAYANAINLLPYAIKEGIQIGEEMPTSQALQYYQLTPSKRSLQAIEETVRSLHASKIADNIWEFKDPLTQRIIRGGADVKGLSEKRIKETLDSYYSNWNISGDSSYDKQRILIAEGLHPINDMGIFNTPEGKKLYDKHAKFLLGYAYEEDIPATSQDGASKNKSSGSEENKLKPFIPIVATTYGEQNGNGFVINSDGTSTNIPLNSRDGYEMQFIISDQELHNLNTRYNELENKNDPQSILEKKELKEKIMQNERMHLRLANEQKAIERELYGRKSDPEQIKIAKEEATAMAPKVTPGSMSLEELIKHNEENEKWIKNKTVELLEAKGFKIEAELSKRYDKYNNYLTTGKSYAIINSDDVKQLTTIMQNFQNKNIKYKNVLTNQETNIDDINNIIPKDQNGIPDYSRLSYEVLLDEKDGPVLLIHGVGKNGTEGYEVSLENFSNVREFFGRMLSPEEQAYMTKFTQASQSLKANKDKNEGSFSVNTLDGSQNNVNFSRQKIGDGKYGYFVEKSSDGTENKMYGSMEDMIYNETLPYSMTDMAIKMLYGEMNAALKNKDYNQATEKYAAINKLLIEGKLSPQTKKDPLGLGK